MTSKLLFSLSLLLSRCSWDDPLHMPEHTSPHWRVDKSSDILEVRRLVHKPPTGAGVDFLVLKMKGNHTAFSYGSILVSLSFKRKSQTTDDSLDKQTISSDGLLTCCTKAFPKAPEETLAEVWKNRTHKIMVFHSKLPPTRNSLKGHTYWYSICSSKLNLIKQSQPQQLRPKPRILIQ